MSAFTKYKERGAYHWRSAYPRSFLKAYPGAHARYDVALRFVRNHLAARDLQGADIGCGDGVFIYKAMRRRFRIIGIDLSLDGLVLASRELAARGFRSPFLVCADCYAVPLPGHSLEYVVSVEMIEHLEQPSLFLTEVTRLLKSGGIFVCTTPRGSSGDGSLRDPFHVREFAPEELGELLSLYFDRFAVKGIYPEWLDRAFRGLTGSRWINRSLRLAIRILSVFYNPYSAVVYDGVGLKSCSYLLGVGWVGQSDSDL